MTRNTTLAELPKLVGEHLGWSEWLTIAQSRIDTFAAATDDHQWIHVDPVRAAEGPFGTTIAHGYLTLSLLIPLWEGLLDVRDAGTKVNYGLNRVRFTAPTPADGRIRLGATINEVTQIRGGVQIVLEATIELEGSAKPACVAQPVFRFFS